jgi:hypothetical protein
MKKGFVFLLAVAGTLACATTKPKVPTRDTNVITESEINAAKVSNAFEAVDRLRPAYLRSRGRTRPNAGASAFARIYLDGQPYGDISTLRNIQIGQVREIHYYSGSEAMTRFGSQTGNGVIEIISR